LDAGPWQTRVTSAAESAAQPAATAIDDRLDLRLALVMNGGVSLAIWMSGVTREIDRLRQHEGAYGELLDLIHATARVDVIAGASAGGLSGSLLGLAVATESEVSSALNLWIERGGLKAMVRDPFEADPPSLLRGDDYFLSEVSKALGTIAATAGTRPPGGGEVADAKDHDLHVILTTTTLSGEQKGYPDYFETVIRDVDHRQAFVFSRTRNPPRNDFGTDERSLARLALAARTTSSFPGAFEPSFIPIEVDGRDDLHPAMKGIATFGHDRWAIDGGVLVNTPFRRALDAIKTLPAEREVRRVLVYIVASTGSTVSTKDDLADEMPDLREIVLGSLSDLPRVQSFREELEEITEINQRTAERRRARRGLLLELGSAGLIGSAEQFMPAYVKTRAEAALADVANIVAQELGAEASIDQPAPTVDRKILRDAVPIPWASATPVWTDDPADWVWGIAPIEYGANVVLDLLREALHLREQPPSLRPLLQGLRGDLHKQLAKLRDVQEAQREFWRSQARTLADGTVAVVAAEWQERAAAQCGAIAFELGRIAAAAAAALPGYASHDADVSETVKLARAIVPRGVNPAGAAVRTLLALHVVQRAAGSELAGIEQTVELVQLSANTTNSFDGRDRASDKLAGLQLHHFGAFYKRSWRANDWLWGRLDSATRLVQIVLDPRRLQRLAAEQGLTAAAAAERIVEIATSGANDQERDFLSGRWKIEQLQKELAFLDDPTAEAPRRLPLCWAAVATGIQWRILHEQLADVAAAARADVNEKCLPTASGAVWANELPPERMLSPAETVQLFTTCFVGSERIDAEFETDYFTSLVSQAGAVGGSLLKGKHSGLPKPARRLATFVRGVLITLYLLVRGVTSGSRIGMFAVALALAVGGAFLGLTLIASPPAFVTSTGMVLVLAGFALAFLRGADYMFAIGTAAVIAVIAGVAVLVEQTDWFDDLPRWLERLLPVVPIVVLAALAMLLGVVRKRPAKAT
jgi:patatin-related protein